LADVKGTEVTSTSRLWGTPANFRFYHRVLARWWVWGVYFLAHFRLASRDAIPKWVAPWLFTIVRVPTYEKYSETCRVTDGPGLRTSYNKECFRFATTSAHARGAERPKCRPGKNQNEHDNVIGNSSIECPVTNAPVVAQTASGSRRGSDVGGESSDAAGITPPGVTPRESRDRKKSPQPPKLVSKQVFNDDPTPKQQQCTSSGTAIVSRTLVAFVNHDDANQGVCVTNRAAKNLYVGRGMRLESAIERSAENGSPTSTTDLAIDVECILDRVWDIKPLPGSEHTIVEALLGFFANPAGKFSDKSAYPEGTRILPMQPGAATPDNFASYPLGDLVVALPMREAEPANISSRKPRCRTRPQGRAGQKFHQDRNQRETRRPEKHITTE
jgi:hypothetical protein